MSEPRYGYTVDGAPITDELVERLAEEAQAGFDVGEILRQREDRGTADHTAGLEWVRLDPELQERLRERAERDGSTASAVIRSALRRYLGAA